MTKARTPREIESRESEAREEYTPASQLPEPTPQPGYEFRWIATHYMGQANHQNVSRKTREGWEPVKAEDHPELMLGSATGNVEIGGLMLCKIPTERVQARTRYYQDQAAKQVAAVDNTFMQQNNPLMPKFNKSRSSASRGSRGFGTDN